ncbi:MAG: hypothetical protein Q7R74_00810 [bacterium]|nr:hypothetical protein [bacterium]
MMKHAVPYCRFGDRALFRVVYEKSAILLMPIPALDKLSVEIDELLFSVLGKNQDIALPQLARAKLAPCGDEIFERYYPIEYMTTKYPPPTIFPSLLSFIRFPDYIAQYMNGSLGFRKHLGIRLVRTLRKACLRY